MNELGLIVVEAAARATILALVGLAGLATCRRLGPAAGALVGATTLGVMVAVAALALSPWPRWWTPGRGPAAVRPVVAGPAAPVGGSARPAGVLVAPVAAPGIDPAALWADFAAEFRRELARPTPAGRRDDWRWPGWVAGAFLAGLALAGVRLALGVGSIRALRAGGRAIEDPTLLDLMASLRLAMGLRRPVALRETGAIATPATVGWRRPVVLLPVDWAGWDQAERRAVLAHELAHVARGDYLVGLLAQVSLSLHFYHPLAHVLAGRLRLQQELAADAWGARLAGGRRPYLTILANLALRQDPKPAAWPARPFLPHRGTFLRRIEMLRNPKVLEQPPLPARRRALTIAALVAAGLLVAGLRGPGAADRALAQQPTAPPAAAAAPDLPPVDPATARSDAHLVLDVRPLELLKNPEFKRLAGQATAGGSKELAALASGAIEQLVILGFERPEVAGGDGERPFAVVVRSARPFDWRAHISPTVEEVRGEGFAYLRTDLFCYRILDDRTLLMGTEADVKNPPVGGDRPRGRHGWDETWKGLGTGPIRLAFDTPWAVRQLMLGPLGSMARTGVVAPLADKVRAYGLTADLANGLALAAHATVGDEADAPRVADTVRAVLTLARNLVPDLRLGAERTPQPAGRPLVDLVDALDTLLDSARVQQDKSVVRLTAQADAATFAAATRLLVPTFTASREAASRARSANNLKQIGLAMHNYYAEHNCFPPAILYGPDGKTPHSWRVALLPYLAAESLHKEYKFDEPWDGPSNRKLLARMPSIYRDPAMGGANPSITSYFVPTGPATLFPPRKEGTSMTEVTDGTSNTIMAIEARREIPWTKPEDIPVDPTDRIKPLPQLGGLFSAGFNILKGDGAVVFLKDSINPMVLRALLTGAGGEVISADAY